jgi:hypothetical protein
MDSIGHIPSLSETEFRTLLEVLSDFDACVQADWMIVGSISYRVFAPEVRTEPGLRDVDLLVYPTNGEDPRLLVSPDIKRCFYVVHIGEPGRGYYYQLLHKEKGVLVDVFTDEMQPHRRLQLGNLQVAVSLAERTLVHALVHLLTLDGVGGPIEPKRPYNANRLWEALDRDKVLRLFENNLDRYQSYLPADLQGKPPIDIVRHALSLKPRRTNGRGAIRKKPITTVHGIAVEDRATLRRVLTARKPATRLETVRHKLYRLKMAIGNGTWGPFFGGGGARG